MYTYTYDEESRVLTVYGTGTLDPKYFSEDILAYVKLPHKLSRISDYLFKSCYLLEEVVLPKAVTLIGEGAFQECRHLRKINLPEGLTKIEGHAFNFCKRMESIVIPSTVESIGNEAFMDCIALKDVYFKGDAPVIGSHPFHAYYGFANVAELHVIPDLTLYYPAYCSGWWDPEWNGYPTQSWTGTFVDVEPFSYYEQAVHWAVERGITNGTGELTFSPNEDCTRGQIVTFLWRAVGCPEPGSVENPFKDIRPKDYYYKAVLWAVGEGITKGMTKDTFAPNETCTRAQVVTFLWRADGKLDYYADWETDFADVPDNSYYTKAVAWAYGSGITEDVGKGLFAPDAQCTRAQIVTFLYRYYY